MTRLLTEQSVAERSRRNKSAWRRAESDEKIVDRIKAEGIAAREIKPDKKPRIAQKRNSSAGEQELAKQLRALRIYGWQCEYRFHIGRRWRLDFAWPAAKLAVEIEGGVWTDGRHNRGSGFIADMDKYNELALLGWRLLRFTPEMVKSGDAMKKIEIALIARLDAPLPMKGSK